MLDTQLSRHGPPPPEYWHSVTQHVVRVVRVARVLHLWLSMCSESPTNFLRVADVVRAVERFFSICPLRLQHLMCLSSQTMSP